MTTRPTPWPRILAEGAVIVVSILLALTAQAWWDERQERVEERDLLQRLDAEFAAADSVLVAWQAGHRGIAEAGRVLLEQIRPEPEPSLTADSIGRLIWRINYNWTFDPPTGVLSSAISSGQIRIIGSDALRAALASWPAVVADIQTDERSAALIVDTRFVPYLDSQIAWRSVISLSEPTVGFHPSAFPAGLREVLQDREFENLVAGRVGFVADIANQYEQMRTVLRQIRDLIGADGLV